MARYYGPWHGIADEEPPEQDDRAPCRQCGAPMSDADYDDDHGVCDCCYTEQKERSRGA